MLALKHLGVGDAPTLEAFLAQHADTSLLMRSNLKSAGLVDHGQPREATYVAAVDGGRIVGVAAHCWNGMLLLQAPTGLEEVARAAVERSGRSLRGLMGPLEQVVAARQALGLADTPAALDDQEILYTLPLADLVIPDALADGRMTCRRPTDQEMDLVVRWRVAFALEGLGRNDSPALAAETRESAEMHQKEGTHWLAFEGQGEGEGEGGERPVAYAAFIGTLPDMVQVGGVWTPPALRGRGHARTVVAGALRDARAAGVKRGILFARAGNAGAQRAYEAIGFRRAGDYGLVLLPD